MFRQAYWAGQRLLSRGKPGIDGPAKMRRGPPSGASLRAVGLHLASVRSSPARGVTNTSGRPQPYFDCCLPGPTGMYGTPQVRRPGVPKEGSAGAPSSSTGASIGIVLLLWYGPLSRSREQEVAT